MANIYSFSELNFFLLGAPHYILRNSLPSDNFPFFRRVNISIKIAPLRCTQKNISGCHPEGVTIDVIIKTDKFFLFSAFSLKIQEINFKATDLHILNGTSNNVATDCANRKTLCCSTKSMATNYTLSKNPCSLVGRKLAFSDLGKWPVKNGLFNIEPILDMIEKYEGPYIILESCSFSEIYSLSSNQGWVALIITHNNTTGNIKIAKTSFSNLRLYKGIFYVDDHSFFNGGRIKRQKL